MSLEVPICPRCNGAQTESTDNCKYCGALLVDVEGILDSGPEPAAPEQPTTPPLDLQAVDFGVDNSGLLHGLLALTGVFVAMGWMLENPGTYWSRDSACIMWTAGPLLWCMGVAVLWKGRATFAWVGAVWATGAFIVGLMQHNVRLNDDALGLSVLVGGCALLGVVIGRFIKHRWLVLRASAQA